MKKFLKIILIISLIIFGILIIFRSFGYRIYKYSPDSASMHPTISPGDVCLCKVNMKFSYEELARGKIVLLKHEKYDHFLTKRIIAKEKEVIEIRGNKTYIDKKIFREPYANFSLGDMADNKMIDIDSVYVDANKVFVMGDNRNYSMDSRYSSFGLVDIKDIVGKPLLFFWSKDKSKIGRSL